eukprot:EG_transcript_34238
MGSTLAYILFILHCKRSPSREEFSKGYLINVQNLLAISSRIPSVPLSTVMNTASSLLFPLPVPRHPTIAGKRLIHEKGCLSRFGSVPWCFPLTRCGCFPPMSHAHFCSAAIRAVIYYPFPLLAAAERLCVGSQPPAYTPQPAEDSL